MTIKKFAALGVLVATLVGCTQAELTQPPITVTPNVALDAVGIDAYARPRAGGNPAPAVRGQNTVQTRTSGKLSYGRFG